MKLLLQEKSTEKIINSLSDENMSFLIKKSIIKLFGELYVGKFCFTLKAINEKENRVNYCWRCYWIIYRLYAITNKNPESSRGLWKREL